MLWLGEVCQIAQSPDMFVRTASIATFAVETAVAEVFVSSHDGNARVAVDARVVRRDRT